MNNEDIIMVGSAEGKDILDIPIYFFNTKGRTEQEFRPLTPGVVKFYSCGPTVYDYPHIGNMFAFSLSDLLRRMFDFFNYKVIQVMNITDVGHLRSDDDIGEDKIVAALSQWKKQKKNVTVQDVIDYYTSHFVRDILRLGIRLPHFMPFASHHVKEMIDIIDVLVKKSYAYVTKTAVYYDVSRFKHYTKLYPQALDDKIIQARAEVVVDATKKHPADFRLWQLDQPDHVMQWDSPWGRGFPGWHIECSAMSMKYLGATFDIHTGGEDHIPVHHTNEIAQSEACTGKEFANYWLHVKFVRVEGEKMSKSKQNYYVLQDLLDKGFKPQHIKLFNTLHHYRSTVDFAVNKITRAKETYDKIIEFYTVARWRFIYHFAIKERLKQLESQILEVAERRIPEVVKIVTGALLKVTATDRFENIVRFLQQYDAFIEKRPQIVSKDTDDAQGQSNIFRYLDYLKGRELPYMQIEWSSHQGVEPQARNILGAQRLTYLDVKELLDTAKRNGFITAEEAANLFDIVKNMATYMAQDLSTPRVIAYALQQMKANYLKNPLFNLVISLVLSALLGIFIEPAQTFIEKAGFLGSRDSNDTRILAVDHENLRNMVALTLARGIVRRAKRFEIADKFREIVYNSIRESENGSKAINLKIVDTPETSVLIATN